jgi:signal transduction histidine kinase
VPRLAQIEELAETARAAGLEVVVADCTTDDDLPAAVELAAYRIVQEALTNVVRHAHATRAAVSLTPDGGCLVVEVADDGGGPGTGPEPASGQPPVGNGAARPTAVSAGYGIVGMRERAMALGGRFEHGAAPGGGFRVRAVLPTGVDGA